MKSKCVMDKNKIALTLNAEKNKYNMTNKVALITGGSRGLGKDIALKLATAGHDVVITYQSQKEAAEEVVKKIELMGLKAASLPFDANNFSTLTQFSERFQQLLNSKWQKKLLIF